MPGTAITRRSLMLEEEEEQHKLQGLDDREVYHLLGMEAGIPFGDHRLTILRWSRPPQIIDISTS